MDNNLSKAIAVLPDNNPTYSSVDVVTQEQIRQPILNSNNDEVLSYRSNNAFNYLIAFLSEEQCNYLKKLNHGDYIINEEREKFIDLVLNSEGDVK